MASSSRPPRRRTRWAPTCECASAPSKPAHARRLKWKPPSENSIDFRLELRFPPSPSDPSRPDLTLKPAFLLMLNRGKPGEAFFDLLDIDDDVWEEAVASGEQWDNRVVEVVWEPDPARWRMLRFRDDKREGNFETVVDSVIQSIRDGVLEQTVRLLGSRSG